MIFQHVIIQQAITVHHSLEVVSSNLWLQIRILADGFLLLLKKGFTIFAIFQIFDIGWAWINGALVLSVFSDVIVTVGTLGGVELSGTGAGLEGEVRYGRGRSAACHSILHVHRLEWR